MLQFSNYPLETSATTGLEDRATAFAQATEIFCSPRLQRRGFCEAAQETLEINSTRVRERALRKLW
jgi:hypothetical protein